MLARSIRNTAAALAVAALSASTAIALTPAMARHGWGHHGGWGHHHGWAHRDGDGYSSFPQRITSHGSHRHITSHRLITVLAALAFAYVGALNGEADAKPASYYESAIRFTPTFETAIADERHYHG